MSAADLDSDGFRLLLDVVRLVPCGGPEGLSQLLGCRRLLRVEVERLLAQYLLTIDPSEGPA
jgi:hypothetical protein